MRFPLAHAVEGLRKSMAIFVWRWSRNFGFRPLKGDIERLSLDENSLFSQIRQAKI